MNDLTVEERLHALDRTRLRAEKSWTFLSIGGPFQSAAGAFSPSLLLVAVLSTLITFAIRPPIAPRDVLIEPGKTKVLPSRRSTTRA
jgi:hypothetical protein